MADIDRYVNPLSVGGDGTTTAVTGPNAAFASLNAAFAALIPQGIGNPAGDGNVVYLRCFGIAEDTVPIVLPGVNSTLANPIIVTNATGLSGGDPSLEGWDTNAYRHNPTVLDSNGSIFLGGNDSRNFDGIIFRNVQLGAVLNGTANQTAIRISQSPWGGTLWIDKCVTRISGTCSGAAANFAGIVSAPGNLFLSNSLALIENYTGLATTTFGLAEGATSNMYANNNTIRGFGSALAELTAGTVEIGNNLFDNCAVDTSGTVVSVGGNVTSNGSFGSMTPLGSDLVSRSFSFKPSSGQLASNDIGAAELGVDLSANPNLPITDDAFGTARPAQAAYDAGYHERIAATRFATPDTSTISPAGTFTCTLGGFTGNPDAAFINGIAVTMSNISTVSVDLTVGDLSTFFASGLNESTRWNTPVGIEIYQGAEVANAVITIVPSQTAGPDEWFGVVGVPYGDSVFPPGTETGDEYFIERVSGTGLVVLDTGSISSTSPEYEVRARVFDISANSWSAGEVSSFEPLLAGSVSGVTTTTGDLSTLVPPSGTANGQTTSTAELTVIPGFELSGVIDGRTTLSGNLTLSGDTTLTLVGELTLAKIF